MGLEGWLIVPRGEWSEWPGRGVATPPRPLPRYWGERPSNRARPEPGATRTDHRPNPGGVHPRAAAAPRRRPRRPPSARRRAGAGHSAWPVADGAGDLRISEFARGGRRTPRVDVAGDLDAPSLGFLVSQGPRDPFSIGGSRRRPGGRRGRPVPSGRILPIPPVLSTSFGRKGRRSPPADLAADSPLLAPLGRGMLREKARTDRPTGTGWGARSPDPFTARTPQLQDGRP